MSWRSRLPNARVAFAFAFVVILTVVPATTVYAQEESAIQYFREHLSKADSVTKMAALVFVTVMLGWLQLIGYHRLLLGLIVVTFMAAAAAVPRVRESRLVRVGLFSLFLGLVPLVLAGVAGEDNALGAGFLFAFVTPVGLVTVVTGAIGVLVGEVVSRLKASGWL
jgi:hypothetical protein